jgi:HSP20 family protein
MPKQESKELSRAEPSREVSRFEPMEKWFDEVERWFDEDLRRPFSLMRPRWIPRFRSTDYEEMSPSVDIFEEGDTVVVKAELPGMSKDNINVSVTDSTMTISGEKKHEEKVEKKDYYRMERSYGSFSRSFRLPAEVQMDKAKANFKDGILEIRVPKTEEAKSKEKKIPIQ